MIRLKYLLGVLVSLPFLPWMYIAAKSGRRQVPQLEEAIDRTGFIGSGNPFNLLIIGESTMAGVGVHSHKEGYAGKLAACIAKEYNKKVQWEVNARSGYTAALCLRKLLPKITMVQPQIIIIGLGANDAFTLNTPWNWRKQISNLITALQQKFEKVPIVFINLAPVKEFPALPPILKNTIGNLLILLGEELAHLVHFYKQVYFIDEQINLATWAKKYQLSKNPSLYFSDGIHPSAETYNLWAKDTFDFISSAQLIQQK